MDPSAPRICRWRGCYSFEVAAGSIYCSEHRALLHPGRRPQPDNQHALSTSSSNPALGPPNPLHAATSAKATSPKKQLSERYTARKGAKLSTSGPAHGPSATHTQRPSADVLSANPRPAKRQRGQDMPDVSGVPRSGSSSFSETGVPPLTNRDDFALRPKKKETASERPRSFNDQRPLHRGGNHLGFTRRPASSSSRPLQSTSKKSPCPEPIVIDLTGDDDDEPPLIPPKTQSSIHNYVRYGISMGLQGPPKPHVSSNVAPGPSRQPKEVVTIGDKQRGESVQQSQPGPRSQVQHNKPVAENVVIPSSTAPLPSKSQNEHSFAVPTSKEKMDLSALSDRPVHAESSGTSTLKHHDSPDIQPRQPVKIDQPWLDGKKSPPVGSNPNASAPEQAMLGRIFQTTVRGKPPPVQEVKSKEAVKPREQSNPLSEQTKTKELVKATERDKTPKHSNAEEAAQATGQVKPVLEQPKVREASKTTELNGHVPTQTTAKEPSTNGVREKPTGDALQPTQSSSQPPTVRHGSLAGLLEGRHHETLSPDERPLPRVKEPTTNGVRDKPTRDVPQKTQPLLQPPAARNGSFSDLLEGRQWKTMSPEERRLFWVSQHEPEKLDAYIYSENNRPFRPGDPLFGVPRDELPPRPQRPAAGFTYLDPRKAYSHQPLDEWYRNKQVEIRTRGKKKECHLQCVKRAVERKQEKAKAKAKAKSEPGPEPAPAPEPEPEPEPGNQDKNVLPQFVQDNPKWLQALEVIKAVEAQTRKRRESKQKGKVKPKAKTKAVTTASVDPDTERQES